MTRCRKIYQTGVGGLVPEAHGVNLNVITKLENFRCSHAVITVLNHMRPNLQQVPSGNNKLGAARFFYTTDDDAKEESYDSLKAILTKDYGWDFSDATQTKSLFLTHRTIAKHGDFDNLFAVYQTRFPRGRDEKLYGLEDEFASFLFNGIEELVNLYEHGKYNEFLKKTSYQLKSIDDKTNIKSKLDELGNARNTGTIQDVMTKVFELELLQEPQKIKEFKKRLRGEEPDDRDVEFYKSLMEVSYLEVQSFYSYLSEGTVFKTKHGVKGAEFENVLVVIDDAAWNLYKFEVVFTADTSNQNRYDRSLNLLYVSCSRAKNNLAILFLDFSATDFTLVEEWFEEENVIELT